MSKEQLDLLHYQNKVYQLTQLLEVEKQKNLELRKILVELKFSFMPWVKKLEKL